MRGITRDCLAELVDRKVIWFFAAIVFFSLLAVLATGNIEAYFHVESYGGGDMDALGQALGDPVLKAFDFFMTIMVFLAVLASAGAIPRTLERGRIDFYLSKPISRTAFLLNRLFGIWAVFGGLILTSGLVIFGAVGLVHGVFDLSIVWLQLLWVVTLLIWLSISCLFGVLTGSTAGAMIAVFLVWLAESVLDKRDFVVELLQSRILNVIFDGIYLIIPKASATSDIFYDLVAGRDVSDWMPLWTTAIVCPVLILLSVWWMKHKDF